MDLGLFARVLWRHRYVVAAGAVVAVLIAVASMTRVSFGDGGPRLEYRQDETWVSHARLLVTQQGFPQGRANLAQDDVVAAQQPDAEAARGYLSPARSVELAQLYARIANADQVRAIMFARGGIEGAKSVTARAEEDLPTIGIESLATSRASAVALAQRQVDALLQYLAKTQQASGVPVKDRVRLAVVRAPGSRAVLDDDAATWLLKPRSKMLPLVVFLAVMGLVVGLVFLLENVRRSRAEERVERLAVGEPHGITVHEPLGTPDDPARRPLTHSA